MLIYKEYIPHTYRNKYLKNVSTYTSSSSSAISSIIGGSGEKIKVIDNLDSVSTEDALSANQGRILNEKKLDITGGKITGDLVIDGSLDVTNLFNANQITTPYIYAQEGNFNKLFGDTITSDSISSDTITSDTILTDRITSINYQSGNKGFSIDANGNAEFSNLNIRGEFSTNSINYNKITSTNGEVWITDSAQVISIDDSTKQVEVTDNVFRVDDELLCQVFNGNSVKRCEIKITALITSSTESATYQYTNISNSDKLIAGDTLVRTSNIANANRNQYIKLSPYNGAIIDVINNSNVSARLGCLSGITSPKFGVLSSYGLFAKNAYLEGAFATSSTQFNVDGSGHIANRAIQFDANGNITFSNSVKLNWQNDINSATTTINNKIENLELSATTVSSAVTECNNNYYELSNKVGNKLTYIDSTGIYTGTLAANQIVTGTLNSSLINTDEILSNGDAWALKKDGSGYLSNKKIEWDAAGNLTLKLGTKKEFKTVELDDYETTSFILDLNDGYNFVFTKNTDNNERTIELPTDKSLDGIDVELVFRGNPGIIYVTTNRSYGFKYNAAWVNKVTLGTRDVRLKLAARISENKTYIEWWIENDSAFDLYSKISAKRYDYCENKYYN
ncbi:hypothetical protein [Bacteroides salyersiae]|jgi:hypothetical protein|uniref:hypothetical protein n=1 Tax=Bacteroides salyersiae TaxID=291644 RepID=UPI00101DC07C|nr:hypothetical protein [Bacteroides salyersiae]DAE60925.1 MAG TPA: hypothetical protein [Caudoviricetes sp.]